MLAVPVRWASSLSLLFIDIYHLSELHEGLIYLLFGVDSVLEAYCSGMLLLRALLHIFAEFAYSRPMLPSMHIFWEGKS